MRYDGLVLKDSRWSVAFASGVLFLAACSLVFVLQAKAEDSAAGAATSAAGAAVAPSAAKAPAAAPAIDVDALWKKHCKSCHGSDGRGKTKAGRAKKVKDFTDPKIVAEFDRCEMIKRVTEGILDDKGKARMKTFAKKLSKTEIEALVDHVIGLSK